MTKTIILICALLAHSISYGEPINEIREGAIYYMKGITSDSKVEVLSVNRGNRKVKVFEFSTKETHWVSPSSLVNTTESISRDINRVEFTVSLLDFIAETITTSNYALKPYSKRNESYEGYRTCLYNFSDSNIKLRTYFDKYVVLDFSGNGKHHKLTKTQNHEIKPYGLLEVRFYSKTYDSIGLAWKRSDMREFEYSSAGGVMKFSNSKCNTYGAWLDSSAIVAGVFNPNTGRDYWSIATNCTRGPDAQKKCVDYEKQLPIN